MREAMAALIVSYGFDVEVFDSGRQALAFDQLDRVACVVADVQMPVMSGLELQQQLTQGPHALPLIFVTAIPNDGDRGRALAAGAVGYLAKPVAPAELVELIRSAVERRR